MPSVAQNTSSVKEDTVTSSAYNALSHCSYVSWSLAVAYWKDYYPDFSLTHSLTHAPRTFSPLSISLFPSVFLPLFPLPLSLMLSLPINPSLLSPPPPPPSPLPPDYTQQLSLVMIMTTAMFTRCGNLDASLQLFSLLPPNATTIH